MKKKIKERKLKTEWHKWFAWRPVIVEDWHGEYDYKVWLEFVDRKGEFVRSDIIGGHWEYEYRLPFFERDE